MPMEKVVMRMVARTVAGLPGNAGRRAPVAGLSSQRRLHETSRRHAPAHAVGGREAAQGGRQADPGPREFEGGPSVRGDGRLDTPLTHTRLATTAMWLCQGLALPRCSRRITAPAAWGDGDGSGRANQDKSRVVHTLAELRFALSVLGVGAGALILGRKVSSPGAPLADELGADIR